MPKTATTAFDKIALDVIDTWLAYRIRHTDLPGVQICIRKKGTVIFSKAYGVANTKTKRALKTTDLFHIASHSKMFTSCALLMLQEQERLNIADKIVTYIPELRQHADKRFKDITIRDLLSNRSGIFRDGVDCEFWRLQKPFLNKKRLLDEVLSTDLIYEPNTHTKYSNIGHSLLGLIIEQVTGQSYADALNDLVLRKLKTKNLLPDYRTDTKHSFADGHSRPYNNQPRQTFKHAAAAAMASATGFCGTAGDTSLFLYQFLYGTQLISKASQKELMNLLWPIQNSKTETYGLGLDVENDKDSVYMGHGGGYPGYTTQTHSVKDTDFIISAFIHTNVGFSMDIIKFCSSLFKKMDSYFKEKKPKNITISPIMLNNWNSQLYVLGKDKALRFDLDSWNPLSSVAELTAKGKNIYLDEKEKGYNYPGEHKVLFYDATKKIKSIKVGGSSIATEQDFLKKTLPKMLARD